LIQTWDGSRCHCSVCILVLLSASCYIWSLLYFYYFVFWYFLAYHFDLYFNVFPFDYS
jgi:hypothetical protein